MILYLVEFLGSPELVFLQSSSKPLKKTSSLTSRSVDLFPLLIFLMFDSVLPGWVKGAAISVCMAWLQISTIISFDLSFSSS